MEEVMSEITRRGFVKGAAMVMLKDFGTSIEEVVAKGS
jgi:hypothetical protein